MKKSHLECPGCSGSEFHLHEITIANPQNKQEAEASSAIVVCSDCNAIVGVLVPQYPQPKALKLTVGPLEPYPNEEGAYGEESC